jgi:hypothetical protein
VFQVAERVGFEPTVATRTTTVFETVPFNRSGTSPNSGANYILNIQAFVQSRIKNLVQAMGVQTFLQRRRGILFTVDEDEAF